LFPIDHLVERYQWISGFIKEGELFLVIEKSELGHGITSEGTIVSCIVVQHIDINRYSEILPYFC